MCVKGANWAFLFLLLSLSAFAATDCKKVRFSDVGWTDITATTALASVILDSLGYETRTNQLSVPVTYMGLKNRDLDVFLGNWMPSMAADILPYQKDGSVETIGTLLKGAKYTLAVPKYVAEAGVTNVAQLTKFRSNFQGKVYGIESGNDGNRLIQKMISENAFDLGSWKLVESGEQAMLMQVLQAVKQKKWVVFLGWEPHPMNQKMELVYLEGADGYFGPKQGSSTVYINARKNYVKECPEIARFLKNFSLTVENENAMMDLILNQKMEPKAAAKKWLQANRAKLDSWLSGVRSQKGEDAVEVVKKSL